MRPGWTDPAPGRSGGEGISGNGTPLPGPAAARPFARARLDGGRVLVTGGAGFIGTNLADRLLSDGRSVRIFDNLSRPGVERNLSWLRQRHGARLEFVIGDVRSPRIVRRALAGIDQVFHLAAQVAVTTSLQRPVLDFSVNAGGTLNLLDAARRLDDPPAMLFTSTNKVYGDLRDLALRDTGSRYVPGDPDLEATGIDETRPLDFHSPYGCSKGAADQYVLDHARTFGLPAAVFRMSCIYGPHQYGNEDQGWVAHFLIRALQGSPLTIYGDGKQVRDILYADDLVDALILGMRRIDELSGRAFNIGGGPERATSLVELIDLIGEVHGRRPPVARADWRAGDQRFYVSDHRRFSEATGWTPRVAPPEGVRRLLAWLRKNRVVEVRHAPAGNGRLLRLPRADLVPRSG